MHLFDLIHLIAFAAIVMLFYSVYWLISRQQEGERIASVKAQQERERIFYNSCPQVPWRHGKY